jgi:hypothetical protein
MMMQTVIRSTLRRQMLASACAFALCATLSYAQRLTWIQNPFTPTNATFPDGNGIWVYGPTNQGILFTRYRSGTQFLTYRWKDGELLKLTQYGDDPITCYPAEDGKAILHISDSTYFWTPLGLVQTSIPPYARYTTEDGGVVVGQLLQNLQPFIWQNNTTSQLPLPQGYPYGEAQRITEDLQFIAGSCFTSSQSRAVRWRFSNGTWQVQFLGTLGGQNSRGGAISSDGKIIALSAQDINGNWRAAVWQENVGLFPLPTLGGNESRVSNNSAEGFSMTSDGRYIVGYSRTPQNEPRAVRWTWQGGSSYTVEDLNIAYAGLLGAGDLLLGAAGISRNGRYIAGVGLHNGQIQVFILDTQFCNLPPDVTGDGFVDDADLLEVLFNFGTRCGG